ncbi:tellurite resistance TerB family protein [Pontibacter ramchanderi]|uniref:Putative tellurite resistance protein B-like protein n=1 Tax=Pontibacter ramchanderi TaxID=1179743 RepID=A0A2N3U8U7_9BACT|nr:TerB family tellurite resistance protein [Pontibacter ramchanderi]PKV63179.1 putative tellurite resistance protein B-like protein [Pontibacter ramchanderi]
MEQEQTSLLKDYTMEEKGAYLAALASIASADGHASEEELEFLRVLSEAAEMPENVEEEVISIARNPSQISVQRVLDVLKKSQLRFSFITDIISFAKADGEYTQEEQKRIQEMASYLGVDQKQYSLLEQFVDKADEAQKHGEDPSSQAFMSKNGFGDMFKNAGISPQMVQGILGIAAPIVLARLMSGGRRRRGGMMGGMGGGLLGGLLGGMMMGRGGLMGGGRRSTSGLGSMASVLGGLNGRSRYGSMGSGGLGGLLGGLLGGKRGGGTGW